MKRTVYLDHAAATPLDLAVIKIMEPYLSQEFYNPASPYELAMKTKVTLNDAKKKIATCLGVKQSEVIITSGGSESNNLAIRGVMQQFPGHKVLVTAIEHESILEPAKEFDHQLIAVDREGIVDLKKLENQIDDEVVLISVMQANNEVGSVQPLREIAQLIDRAKAMRKARGIKVPLYFHSDGCQAPQYLDIHPHRMGLDLYTLNSGKIYGPKQVGLLYIGSKISLIPQIRGGGQQHGIRSGTESVGNTVGLAEALAISQNQKKQEVDRLRILQDKFISGLEKLGKGIQINGPKAKKRLPANLHITVPGVDNERLIYELDEYGIMVASGSACNASSKEPSHVLKAMGRSDKEAQSSIRITMGRSTSPSDVDYCLEVFCKLLSG